VLNQRIGDLTMCGQQPQRPYLILAHETAVALHVGGEDSSEFALHAHVVTHRQRLSCMRPAVVKQSGGLLLPLPSAQIQARKPRAHARTSSYEHVAWLRGEAVLTATLCEEIARLQAEVNRLQAQLRQTSANSHQPPSRDPPSRARVRVRELSTRQRGGQPGHQGTIWRLRPLVLWRKGSFGTQSRAGSDFVERRLTVVASLRQQQRHVLQYVTAACQAALSSQPVIKSG